MTDDPNTPPVDPNPPADPPVDPNPPADPPKKETIAGGGNGDDPVKGVWPEDWRTMMADGDEKAAAHLQRISSPQDFFKSYSSLRTKLDGAKLVDELPEDATEDDIKEWRERNGVPLEAKEYLDKLPDGVVFGEDSQEIVGDFVDQMHAINASPEVVNTALSWYHGFQTTIAEQEAEQDANYHKEQDDALRGEWGGEYRANVNTIVNFLSTAPEGLSENLMGARLSDGTLLGDNPTALKWLLSMANDANPAGFVAPADGSSQLQSIDDELTEIRNFRRENSAAYFKDEKMQSRQRELLEAKEKLETRSKN